MLIVHTLMTGASTLVFIALFTPFANRLRLLDAPDKRKQHGVPVPLVGGLSIYCAILFMMMIVGSPNGFFWFILSATLIVVIGALDDAFNLSVRIRFASQILSTVLIIFADSIWIRSIGLDLWMLGSLNDWVGISITIFAVVGLINGFNMADGLDGLASGHFLIGIASVCSAIIVTNGYADQLDWLIVLMAAVFTFWLVNLSLTPLKRVFLGDAGALLLGFVMAWTLIHFTQKPGGLIHPVVAIWCVTIPVFDTIVVIARRVKNKRSPFSPDRNHLHHFLLGLGLSSRQTLFVILAASTIINLFGIWITCAASPLVSLFAYAILFGAFGYSMLHSEVERRLAKWLCKS